MDILWMIYGYSMDNLWIIYHDWLVVSTTLKNISQLGWLFSIYGKIKNVPNHQSVTWMNVVSDRLFNLRASVRFPRAKRITYDILQPNLEFTKNTNWSSTYNLHKTAKLRRANWTSNINRHMTVPPPRFPGSAPKKDLIPCTEAPFFHATPWRLVFQIRFNSFNSDVLIVLDNLFQTIPIILWMSNFYPWPEWIYV